MFTHYRTQGFIFEKENRSESDQLFKIYAKDFGKIEVLAKGIRKISSKLKPASEIFYLSEIEFIQGKAGKTLTDAVLIEGFKKLRKSLGKIKIARKMANLLDDFLKEEPDKKIWKLIIAAFKELDDDTLNVEKSYLLYYYFFWNLVSILGYKPELYHCLFCQKKLKPEKLYFNPRESGIICSSCTSKIKNLIQVQAETIKILRLMTERDLKTFLRIKTEKKYLKTLRDISRSYQKTVLGGN